MRLEQIDAGPLRTAIVLVQFLFPAGNAPLSDGSDDALACPQPRVDSVSADEFRISARGFIVFFIFIFNIIFIFPLRYKF